MLLALFSPRKILIKIFVKQDGGNHNLISVFQCSHVIVCKWMRYEFNHNAPVWLSLRADWLKASTLRTREVQKRTALGEWTLHTNHRQDYNHVMWLMIGCDQNGWGSRRTMDAVVTSCQEGWPALGKNIFSNPCTATVLCSPPNEASDYTQIYGLICIFP